MKCDKCEHKGKCSAERYFREKGLIPDNCPDVDIKGIIKLINRAKGFRAFEVDKDSKDPVKEFWGKMDKLKEE